MDTALQVVTGVLALTAGGISVAALVSELRESRRARRAMDLDVSEHTTAPPKEQP